MRCLILIANVLLVGLLGPSRATAQCEDERPLFELLSPKQTGVKFSNTLTEDAQMNFLSTTYFYNGGGVAIGDLNNDGLPEIFLTGNQKTSRLYENKGKLKFEDVTKSSGIGDDAGYWATGVNMADVNADGWLDIYVCYNDEHQVERRRNRLYINNQDGTFTERAKELGLDDPGFGVQAAFFDFDKDGDLDMYQLNYNADHIPSAEWEHFRENRDPYAGDKLYRNDNGSFTDISESAGIKGTSMGYGLGVAVSDMNGDHWPDIYVSNDFIEPDYLYINNGDGTFTERMAEYFQHISHFSMGSDINDYNNDGHVDLLTIDMLPEDNKRQKLLYGPDNYEEYARQVLAGYYHQSMRNMLHVNNANGTFSEIGQLAGVSNTDWSWSALFADYDNDGWKDLFVSNGYYKDVTNRDFLKFKGDYYFNQQINREKVDTLYIVQNTESTPTRNYIFQNKGDLTFDDKSDCWGLDKPMFSNGAAHADLDNDGDLDLVISNINSRASIYRNNLRENFDGGNYLSIQLIGDGLNTRAYNSKLMLYAKGGFQLQELMPMRGFQSRMSDVVHFGLGRSEQVDSLVVLWPDGGKTKVVNPSVNQRIELFEKDKEAFGDKANDDQQTLFDLTQATLFEHQEYPINDFKRQPLLMTMLTNCGPVVESADMNGDGLEDLFIGSSKNSQSKILLQQATGDFTEASFAYDNPQSTEADAELADVDGDGDLDILVVSGGYHDYAKDDADLKDRLYINNGTGRFALRTTGLPEKLVSGSSASAADFDKDGDVDFFVGGRVVPGRYPESPESYLLINDGRGYFTAPEGLVPNSGMIGMVTDSEWIDVNGDSWEDLIVIGDLMPITILINEEGKQLVDRTSEFIPNSPSGLWTKLISGDFDGDGDKDFVIGNFGHNSQIYASAEEPLSLVYGDFDSNGSVDPIFSYHIQGESYPFASRGEITNQLIALRQKFTSYEIYSEATINQVLTKAQLAEANKLYVTELSTVYLENQGSKFEIRPMPLEAQISPVFALEVADFNGDGNMDVLLAGNQSQIRIRLGLIDANYGSIFLGDGQGNFEYLNQSETGLKITGDAKSVQMMSINGKQHLVFGINNSPAQVYKMNEE